MAYDYQAIGNRIRKVREAKGITQELLAESMEVSNAYVSKVERGAIHYSRNLETGGCCS